ncbi:MAG: 5'/3'-nucleotidase SurE [Butyrivibrio sp.]|nr:5'/3'-nucleotidase SurE [Butyrivibrio sp.]
MARRILITNDDGIDADGLIRLVQAAKDFGEVWVVAPDGQRSAASHSISLRNPIDVYPYDFPVSGVHAYSCSRTPADCIRVGSLSVMPEKPDIVMTGINFGYNVASDIQYSATVGAALEGEFQGYHSIAFSEGLNGLHETTDKYLKEIMEELVEKEYKPGFIYNVNFPGCKLEKCKGILRDRTVSRRAFYIDNYKEVKKLDNGGISYMVDGTFAPVSETGTDIGAILDNYVSIGLVENLC